MKYLWHINKEKRYPYSEILARRADMRVMEDTPPETEGSDVLALQKEWTKEYLGKTYTRFNKEDLSAFGASRGVEINPSQSKEDMLMAAMALTEEEGK